MGKNPGMDFLSLYCIPEGVHFAKCDGHVPFLIFTTAIEVHVSESFFSPYFFRSKIIAKNFSLLTRPELTYLSFLCTNVKKNFHWISRSSENRVESTGTKRSSVVLMQ